MNRPTRAWRRLQTGVLPSLCVILGAYALGTIVACCPVNIIELPGGVFLGTPFRSTLDEPRQPELDAHLGDAEIEVNVTKERVEIEYIEQSSGERLRVIYDVVDEDVG